MFKDDRSKTGKTVHEQLRIPAKKENLNRVLGFVDEILEAAGCPMKTQMQIDVAVEEIFINVASYAYTPGIGEVEIDLSIEDGTSEAVFEVRDRGVPFDPLQKEDPDTSLSAEERAVGGLGIFMVKKSMDSVSYQYEDGQNILTMKKKF